MANFVIRESKHKVDPRHPESTDPSYERARRLGEQRIKDGKLTFENKGEEESYWKAVKSNPANVPGLPPFAPPLNTLPKIAGIGDGKPTEMLPCGHRWNHMAINDRGTFYRCKFGHEFSNTVINVVPFTKEK